MAFVNGVEGEFTDEGRLRSVQMHIIVESKRGGGSCLQHLKKRENPEMPPLDTKLP